MKLFNKWKSDKKFRKNFIVVAVIVFFFFSMVYKAPINAAVTFPSQDVCSSCGRNIFDSCTPDECIYELGCVYDFSLNMIGYDVCKAGLDTGIEIAKDGGTFTSAVSDYPDTYPNKMCKSGEYKPIDLSFGNVAWRCTPEGSNKLDSTIVVAKDAICEPWQQPLAKLVDSLWKNNGINDCPTKAYITIVAGAFILLAVL